MDVPVAPVQVPFAVAGCDAFAVVAQVQGHDKDGPWQDVLAFYEAVGASYVASVPVADVFEADGCRLPTRHHPLMGALRLRVTCTLEPQTATTAAVPLRYVAATDEASISFVTQLFAMHATPGFVVVLQLDAPEDEDEWQDKQAVAVWHGFDSGDADFFHTMAVGPKGLVQTGTRGYLTTRCLNDDCGTYETADGMRLAQGMLMGLDLDRDREGPLVDNVRFIPWNGRVHVSVAADGAVRVLNSFTTGADGDGGGGADADAHTIVATVDKSTTTTVHWLHERVVAIADNGAFVTTTTTSGVERLRLRSMHDANSVVLSLPGKFPAAGIFLAPEGRQLLAANGTRTDLISATGRSRQVQAPTLGDEVRDVTWGPEMALVGTNSALYLVDRSQGNVVAVYERVSRLDLPLALHNGGFMITDATGLRFLSATGATQGHMSVPRTCAALGPFLNVELTNGWLARAPVNQDEVVALYDVTPITRQKQTISTDR